MFVNLIQGEIKDLDFKSTKIMSFVWRLKILDGHGNLFGVQRFFYYKKMLNNRT